MRKEKYSDYNFGNEFDYFTFLFLDILNCAAEKEYKIEYNSSSLFHKKKKDLVNLKLQNQWKSIYSVLFKKYIPNTNLSYKDYYTTWFNCVKHFSEFIRDAEKCFMFNNSDENCLYVEINDNIVVLYLVPEKLNVKIKITFQNTSIKKPNSKSSILSYIDGDNEEDGKVTFVKVEVFRTFGKQMKNEFEFLLGDFIDRNSKDTDFILFDIVKDIVSNMIFECFIDIIDNYVTTISNYNEEIHIKDVIKFGIRIR